jgi:hypothetical protein
MSRFDYIAYDQDHQRLSSEFRLFYQNLEEAILAGLPEGRERALVLTKLEESFMWVGKTLKISQEKALGK